MLSNTKSPVTHRVYRQDLTKKILSLQMKVRENQGCPIKK